MKQVIELKDGRQLDCSQKTLIMGILNVTPDSFFDGGKYNSLNKALKHVEQMLTDGADIIDIGGESSRPGAKPVSESEELTRTLPIVEKVKKEFNCLISLDTTKPTIASSALAAGTDMINDISGLSNPEMWEVVKKHNCPFVAMHRQGTSETMQQNPKYENIVQEIKEFFKNIITTSKNKNIQPNKLILDPGIGFGKTPLHNLQLIKNIKTFQELGFPLLYGISRKSVIGAILNNQPPERLTGSTAMHAYLLTNDISILRVHDIKETRETLKIIKAIKEEAYA